MGLEIEEKLDDSVPREWVQMAHHGFFRKEKNPIAVRGVAGHLPGHWDVDAFWESVNVGVDYLTTIPMNRWDHAEYYDPAPESWMQSLNFRPPTYIKTNVRHGQYIDGRAGGSMVSQSSRRVAGSASAEARLGPFSEALCNPRPSNGCVWCSARRSLG